MPSPVMLGPKRRLLSDSAGHCKAVAVVVTSMAPKVPVTVAASI